MTNQAATETFESLDQDYTAQLTLKASPDTVFRALTTTSGLAGWWAPVTGEGLTGGELRFSFGPGAFVTMRVDAAEPGAGVRWTTLACHLEDWVGTKVHFDIGATPTGDAELRFRHVGLTPRLECFSDCKSGWDHYLPSLAAYVETGVGNPAGSDADRSRREVRAQRKASQAAG
jgi:uncharacterized protein YndB with AHSA1/START domain